MGQPHLLWRPRQQQRLWHEEWGLYRDGIVDISCSERAEWKRVCVHAHTSPSTLTRLTRLTLPYLWVRAGIIAIPARVYYLGMLMRGSIRSAATAEVARRSGAKGWRGVRTRPRVGQGCVHAGWMGGEMEAEGMRGRMRNMVAMREGGGRGMQGCANGMHGAA